MSVQAPRVRTVANVSMVKDDLNVSVLQDTMDCYVQMVSSLRCKKLNYRRLNAKVLTTYNYYNACCILSSSDNSSRYFDFLKCLFFAAQIVRTF